MKNNLLESTPGFPPPGPHSKSSFPEADLLSLTDVLANLADVMDARAFEKMRAAMETGAQWHIGSFITDQLAASFRQFKKSSMAGDEVTSLKFLWNPTEPRERTRASQRPDENVPNFRRSRGNEALTNDSFNIRLSASVFDANPNLRGKSEPFHAMFDAFAEHFFPLVESKPEYSDALASSHFRIFPRLPRPEFTPLERMGFIMSGGKVQNPYDQRKIDLLQQIARNTSAQTVGRGWGVHDPHHTIRDAILETNAL